MYCPNQFNISIEKIVTDNVNGKITYQITLENAGTSTAYDINLLDDLDSNLNNLSDIAISFSGEVVGVTNSSYETDSQGLNIDINEINIKGFDIQFQEEPINYFSNRWLTCIIIDPRNNAGITRENIRKQMELENIETRPLWKPMHQQPIFQNSQKYINGFSDTLFEHGLCLPSGSNLVHSDFERIFNCLDKFFYKL